VKIKKFWIECIKWDKKTGDKTRIRWSEFSLKESSVLIPELKSETYQESLLQNLNLPVALLPSGQH
jgi:hypothetical protein